MNSISLVSEIDSELHHRICIKRDWHQRQVAGDHLILDYTPANRKGYFLRVTKVFSKSSGENIHECGIFIQQEQGPREGMVRKFIESTQIPTSIIREILENPGWSTYQG